MAGDTSTHLEAVLLDVPAIYHRMNDRLPDDYYGYAARGLAERADAPDEVVRLLRRYRQRRPAVVERARYFNALVGTPDEGRSRKLAAEAVRRLLDRSPSDHPASSH